MEHSFDIDNAKKYSIQQAIIIKNFQFWIIKNKVVGINQEQNRTWTYSTIEQLNKIMPYMTIDSIRYSLNRLLERDVIIKANFNKNPHDRTMWYAFADEDIWVNPYLDSVKSPNPNSKKTGSINIKRYNTNSKQYILAELLFSNIKKNINNFDEPNLNKWAIHIDEINRLDFATFEEIESIINFVGNNQFWKTVILSTDGLRKNYVKLRAQKQQNDIKLSGGNREVGFDEEKYKRLISQSPEN